METVSTSVERTREMLKVNHKVYYCFKTSILELEIAVSPRLYLVLCNTFFATINTSPYGSVGWIEES